MELLLHYVWKHRLFPLRPLCTTGGESVEVIDPGLPNHDAGPDFFNAKLRIGTTLWVGNVEIHERSSDWYAHGHDRDMAYDGVVLHVTGQADRDVVTSSGKQLPQMVLPVPEGVRRDYAALLSADRFPHCYSVIPELSALTLHSFLTRLTAERIERRRCEVLQRVACCQGSWEQALFMTIARSFGFGINGDAFEEWGRCVPLSAAGRHRDNALQIEALFMGQAGFLTPDGLPAAHREAALADEYWQRLAAEYRFLAGKFSLMPMPPGHWRFLRLRPQNFPYIRLAQLAVLYCSRRCGLSVLAECSSASELRDILRVGTTPYWLTHYAFGRPVKSRPKTISEASADSLIINAVVPVLSAYGRHRQDDRLVARAMELLESLRAESNSIVSSWRECGLTVSTAADSQALIQLRRCYCDKRDCLRCRIGYEMLRRSARG